MKRFRNWGKLLLLPMGLVVCFTSSAYALDVTLAWDANKESDLKGYKVYYDTDSGHPYEGTGASQSNSPIDVPLSKDEDPDPNTVQYTVYNLPAGTYYFAVTAYDNEVPSNESGYSNQVSTGTPSDTTPPVISNVQVSSTTDTTALIEWATNEPSDSQVRYGTVTGNYSYLKNNITLVTNHSVTLTDLDPSTTYYFRVASLDFSGNGPTTSDELYFTTDSAPDTTPPIVSDIQVASVTETTATITWTTDEPADSEVQFGTGSTAWGQYPESREDGILSRSHSISLAGLNGSTTYYFRVGSRDASANGPTISPERFFETSAPPDTTPPSIVQYPTIDHSTNSIDVTYSESNMQNAGKEENYAFSPSLLFRTLGGSDDINYLGGNNYRLFLNSIPSHAVFTLTVENVTDESGNLLNPKTIKLNDWDNDGMADDWETAYGVYNSTEDPDGDGLSNLEEFKEGTDPESPDTDGDGLPDGWEVSYGLDPTRNIGVNSGDGDWDGDGFTNYEELVNNTSPVDETSKPALSTLEIVETIPHNDAGTGDTHRVPKDTSFCVRIHAAAGINLGDSESVVFTIDDGTNGSYQRNLGEDTVRVIKLATDDKSRVTKLWVVYNRTRDTQGDFLFDSHVSIRVNVTDATGLQEVQGTCHFKVEDETAHLEATDPVNLPDTSAVDPSDPAIDGIQYDAGVKVGTGDLTGAKIIYKSTEPTVPRFGPIYELPTLTAEKIKNPKKIKTSDRGLPPKHSNAKANRSEVSPVGIGMNLQPPTVFSTPVKLFLPCPGYEDVSDLSVFLYNGQEWVLACDAKGNLMADGEGWMVPGSRVNHNFVDDPVNDPSTIEIWVYHFSGAQAAEVTTAVDASEADAGNGCFVSTIME